MKDSIYAKACTEVLEIISHFSEEDYSKIPLDKIEFFKQNCDKDYEYKIDPEVDLADQYISDEANAIIIGLYKEYFATEHQKNVLDDILKHNQVLADRESRKKYNPDNVFESKEEQILKNDINNIDIKSEESVELSQDLKQESQMIKYKESFLTKLKNFIFRLFHIKE